MKWQGEAKLQRSIQPSAAKMSSRHNPAIQRNCRLARRFSLAKAVRKACRSASDLKGRPWIGRLSVPMPRIKTALSRPFRWAERIMLAFCRMLAIMAPTLPPRLMLQDTEKIKWATDFELVGTTVAYRFQGSGYTASTVICTQTYALLNHVFILAQTKDETMRHLLIILLFLPIMTFAQGGAPYFHLQSVNVHRADVLNDSILVCYPKLDLQNANQTDVVYFNINTFRWEKVGQIPLGQSLVDSFRRGADSIWHISSTGEVWLSANGGSSFDPISIPFSTTQTQTFQSFHKVFNGYLMRFSLSSLFHFYHSPDGVNWTHSGSMSISNSLQRLSFVGDTIYYLNIGNEIMRNTNGGQTISNNDGTGRFVPTNNNNFQAISHDAFFAWNSSEVNRSGDGGQNWGPVNLPGGGFSSGLVRVRFKDLAEGVFTFNPAGSFYTLDTGNTLMPIPQPAGLNSPLNLRYMGDRLLSGTGLFHHFTSDYGQNWQELTRINVDDIRDIHFRGQLGLLVGEDGAYMVSRNGGYWFEAGAASIGSSDLTACHIINDTSMMVGNFAGVIYRSTDGGANWVSVGGGGSNTVYRIKSNPQGYVLIQRGTNSRFSNDFGRTTAEFGGSQGVTHFFDLLPNANQMRFVREHGTEFRVSSVDLPVVTSVSPVQISNFPRNGEELVDLNMATDQTGYVLMKEGTEEFITFKTTNGGTSWTRQAGMTAPVTLSRQGLKFQTFGAEALAIAQYRWNQSDMDYNRLFFSSNGGQSWTTVDIPDPGVANFSLRSAHFFNMDSWMVGFRSDRLVLNGFADGGSNPSAVAALRKPTQLRIYPNPTHTEVHVQLPDQPCQLTITDLKGRVLHAERLEGGLQWLPLQLPAGMYMVHAFSLDGHYQSFAKLVIH